MTDCNLGAGQPPAPCTDQNSLHPPQRNGDVLPERRDLVGDPSKSIESLVSACGDGSSVKFKKCNSNTCKLNINFKPSDRIVSSVTHRTYSCINNENKFVTCNSSNVIYLITCSKCFVQYVGETAQQLNVRFGKHRACMSGKLNSSSCKRLSDHFSKGFCKGADYSVQIIEKWRGNGRTERGSIDLGLAVLRRKRETEWMRKLRTVYPYGLNDRLDMYSNDNHTKDIPTKLRIGAKV